MRSSRDKRLDMERSILPSTSRTTTRDLARIRRANRRAVAAELRGFRYAQGADDRLDGWLRTGEVVPRAESPIPYAAFERVEHPSLHPGRSAAIELDGVQIGVLGELHPRVARRFGIEARTAVAEIDLELFAGRLHASWNVQPVGRHQPVRQDFAVVVAEETNAAVVEAAVTVDVQALRAVCDVCGDGFRRRNNAVDVAIHMTAEIQTGGERTMQIRVALNRAFNTQRHRIGTIFGVERRADE